MKKIPLEKNPELKIDYRRDYSNWWRNIKKVVYRTAYIYCFDENSTNNSASLSVENGKIVYCTLEINGHFESSNKQYVLSYLNKNQHRIFSVYKDIRIEFKHNHDENWTSSHVYAFDGINIYSADGYAMETPYQYD